MRGTDGLHQRANINDEESASGTDVDELTEGDNLIEELCMKEERFADTESGLKIASKAKADDVTIKALERIRET